MLRKVARFCRQALQKVTPDFINRNNSRCLTIVIVFGSRLLAASRSECEKTVIFADVIDGIGDRSCRSIFQCDLYVRIKRGKTFANANAMAAIFSDLLEKAGL